MKLNKIALAVAVASGAMAVHTAAQADSVFFPYVVYGGAVTTVINIIDNVPADQEAASYYEGGKLHYVLVHKDGQRVNDNSASCSEYNTYLPISRNDLQTMDLGAHFTEDDDQGVMFNDPGFKNKWKADSSDDYALAAKAAKGEALRGYLVVDNANVRNGDRTLAGEAFIFDYVDGAAWGYRAFATDGDSDQDEEFGSGAFEFNYTGSLMWPGTAVSFMPLEESTTRFFVTPLSPYALLNYPYGGNHRAVQSPAYLSFTTAVYVGMNQAYDAYNRDERPTSGAPLRRVTCVGYVELNDDPTVGLLNNGAATDVADGGWTRLYTTWPDGEPDDEVEDTTTDTPIAHVFKLEFTAKGVFNGKAAPGVYNNGFDLSFFSTPDLWTTENSNGVRAAIQNQ